MHYQQFTMQDKYINVPNLSFFNGYQQRDFTWRVKIQIDKLRLRHNNGATQHAFQTMDKELLV